MAPGHMLSLPTSNSARMTSATYAACFPAYLKKPSGVVLVEALVEKEATGSIVQ